MDKCKCDKCEFCSGYYGHGVRKNFHCHHPNQKYIIDFFDKNKIQSMPAFIGFGEKFADVPKRKTTPKWCPADSEV